eukprot:5593649-Prymnesium_polylepis.1
MARAVEPRLMGESVTRADVACRSQFDRILRVQREAEELEHQAKFKKAVAATSHMEELQAQILMNAEVRKKNRMDFLEEGVGQRAKMVRRYPRMRR